MEFYLEIDPGDLELSLDDVQEVTTSDHSKLTNRDLPDQHPIKAITGLQTELDEKVEGDAITNVEIDEIWKTIMGG